MAKFLFFNIPSTGHVNPAQPIVKGLVDAGHEVVYANAAEVRVKAEATGARFVPYPAVDHLSFFDNVNLKNFARNGVTLMHLTLELLPFVDDLVQVEQPDVIIHDSLAPWGQMIARKHQIPLVSFYATFVMTPRTMRTAPLRSNITMMGQTIAVLPEMLPLTRRLKQGYGVGFMASPGTVTETKNISIVFTAADFHPFGDTFDDTFKFIGPSLGERPRDTDFDFARLDGSPLVYISLGTIANQNTAFYQTCFEAFADEPGQYVLSVGKQTPIASLGRIPDNFFVYNFVPQLELLQRVDAFVTHGGLNSVHEGLIYGVPLVVFPQHQEQAMVAAQVIKQGVGVGLQATPPYGTTNATALRERVRQVLAEPSYRDSAKQLGDKLRAAGGAERGIAELIRFANH